ncbi:hypothetical protein BC936DRAFT_145555 [Jimgerdemannia flammicorona]|uniref:Uncharacterized protein n=1 Tax=Jimgerdemannia flammicorona TaxID=994334 RepID=A0A433DM98_9FUNG|nr:hypothetical protein BC936DRAFT_145555 [Jimgerdemannia flammicorona]
MQHDVALDPQAHDQVRPDQHLPVLKFFATTTDNIQKWDNLRDLGNREASPQLLDLLVALLIAQGHPYTMSFSRTCTTLQGKDAATQCAD